MSRDAWDNVEPLKPRLGKAAAKLVGRIERADDIPLDLDRPYLIKGWLDRNAVSIVYGDANVGKSFWAIDLAKHVHEGLPWAGCRVCQSEVLYVDAEGGAMFAHRLHAAKARFDVLRGPFSMVGQRSEAVGLSEAFAYIEAQRARRFGLVVFDTFARVMAGSDENAAADIAALMRSADLIRNATGAHVMFLHHTGHAAKNRARGHSSLRAAVDTEIALEDDEAGIKVARAAKQRDLPGGAEQPFRLELYEFGHDSEGEMVTSRIVRH